MAKKATTLHDLLGNDLLPVTNASITFMDNGTSVQAEIIDLKLKTQYNKGHFTTPEELNSVYPSTYPDGTIISNEDSKLREGWYAVVGSTDTMWIWDVQGKEWVNSGSAIGAVESVNGLDGEVILTGSNINATATIDTTSVTKSVNGHLNDIYSSLENKLNANSENVVFTNTNQDITGLKTIKSDHEYDGVPPSMLELNNNHLGNTRKLGLSTTENFNLYLTSYYPDSENYKYLSELSLQGQYLLFGRLDGQTFSNVNGIKFENNDLYKMYIDYANQSVDQKRIVTESDLLDYATKDELSQEIQNITDIIPTNDIAIASSNTKYAISNSSTELSNKTLFESTPTNTAVRMRGCIYGNGIYVVVGTDGAVERSTNAQDWELIDPFTNSVIVSVAYGGGYFICVDSTGGIFKSSDCITWVQLTSNITDIINAVIYVNGKFALVGANGLIAFSNDGETFTTVDSGVTNELTSITRGLDKYVAVSTAGDILTSINGVDWTNTSVDTTHYRTATFGKNIFVIGGQGGKIKYSTDAIHWEDATHNSTSSVNYIRDIKYANGKFYAVMYISTGQGEIWTSIDGATWIKTQTTAGRLWCLGYGNDILFASGDSGAIWVLDLDINWLDTQPTITSGQYIWSKEIYYLTDGSVVEGEVEVYPEFTDLLNKIPTDYATIQQLTDGLNSKQNNLTNSQLQAVNSGANTTNINQITTNSNNINTINSKIPNQASSTNQLADRDFVNSSLNSITAFYITSNSNGDPFSTVSALTGATTYYSGGEVRTPTRNDYAIVLSDANHDNATTRYIYYNQWEYQYTVNETPLTADQLSAINSGITSTLVGKISSNETMLNSLAEQVATDYATKNELSSLVTTSTEQTITGTKKFTANNNTFTRTLVLGANTPINFTGIGSGTYNIGAFVCNTTDKFGVECPRESDSGSAPIVPFRVGARGGQLGILQAGDMYQNGKQVANKEDIPDVSGKLTGTKFATNASFNTYLPYTESGSGNTSPAYVATFVSNSARNGLTFSSVSNLKTQMGIPNFVTLTQAEYDALSTKDSNTYYFIKE